jgi:hypothetical protein
MLSSPGSRGGPTSRRPLADTPRAGWSESYSAGGKTNRRSAAGGGGGGAQQARATTTASAPDTEKGMVVLSWDPRVFLYKGLLTDEECDHIIAKADPRLYRSGVVDTEKARPPRREPISLSCLPCALIIALCPPLSPPCASPCALPCALTCTLRPAHVTRLPAPRTLPPPPARTPNPAPPAGRRQRHQRHPDVDRHVLRPRRGRRPQRQGRTCEASCCALVPGWWVGGRAW